MSICGQADTIAAENTWLKETAAAGAEAVRAEPGRAEPDATAGRGQVEGRLQDTQASLARLQEAHQDVRPAQCPSISMVKLGPSSSTGMS